MSSFDGIKSELEMELRSAVGKVIPDATEQAWLTELAADLAAQKVRRVAATTEEERARVDENLEILMSRWKLRLDKKELAATQTAEKVMKIAVSTAMNVVLPSLGPAGSIAKVVLDQAMNRSNGASA